MGNRRGGGLIWVGVPSGRHDQAKGRTKEDPEENSLPISLKTNIIGHPQKDVLYTVFIQRVSNLS
jgi:hypothetical protein